MMASIFGLRLMISRRDVARYLIFVVINKSDVASYVSTIYFQSSLTAVCSAMMASNLSCLRTKISPNMRS
jgi:hypothetical protein